MAVRDFALPSPLTGSIEVNSGYSQVFGGDRLSEGRDVHTLIQKQRQKANAVYKLEQKVAHKFECERYIFSVSGRVDGFIDGLVPIIEEIKSTVSKGELVSRLKEDRDHPYSLQLATYAYMVYLDRQVAPRTRFLITGNDDQYEELEVPFELSHYEPWLERRLSELCELVEREEANRSRRQEISQLLFFPFASPRPGQRELVDELFSGLQERTQILIQAPTGLGKTVGVVYPVLKDALERGQRVVYVTPKNSQHAGAQEAIEKLREGGCSVKSLTLNAKARMCLKEEVICNPGYCQYARDYYDKVSENKLVEKMAGMTMLSQEQFKELGEQYEVCPFELSLDGVANTDVIVADYNYVFSPRNTLGRFTWSLSKTPEKPNLVIDEAHNLPQRACDYYSKSLSYAELASFAEKMGGLSVSEVIEAKSTLSEVLYSISTVGRTVGGKECKVTLAPAMFEKALGKLQALMLKRLQNSSKQEQGKKEPGKSEPGGDPIAALVNYLSDFVDALAFEGDEFFHLYTRTRGKDGADEVLKVVCCDASSKLKLAHKEFAHVVGFSATIKPFQYFLQLCGFEEDASCKEYLSPFPKENRKILVIPQVSTKYADRERNYDKIARAVSVLTAVRPGNYFVFFPSFQFLQAVFERASKLIGEPFRLLKQESEISRSRANEILAELTSGLPTLVFAVQGGVFAEGVDYPGEMIIGALVVGPGLPNYNFEREQIRDYYQKRYGSGFDYAYIFPAMAKVVQAAGRVIRSDRDRGLIVLMDKRFTENQYVSAMPNDWSEGGIGQHVSNSLVKDIESFWQTAYAESDN